MEHLLQGFYGVDAVEIVW